MLTRKKENTLILSLVLNPDSKSADDKYADIYLWNDGHEVLYVEGRADFTVTVNEDTGESVTHGTKPGSFTLKPGSYALVGDIIWWELDSALWFDVYFKSETDREWNCWSYNLKKGKTNQGIIPIINKECWILTPDIQKTKP